MKNTKPSKYEQESWSTTTSYIIITIAIVFALLADNI
jgi:hypothetical protein